MPTRAARTWRRFLWRPCTPMLIRCWPPGGGKAATMCASWTPSIRRRIPPSNGTGRASMCSRRPMPTIWRRRRCCNRCSNAYATWCPCPNIRRWKFPLPMIPSSFTGPMAWCASWRCCMTNCCNGWPSLPLGRGPAWRRAMWWSCCPQSKRPPPPFAPCSANTAAMMHAIFPLTLPMWARVPAARWSRRCNGCSSCRSSAAV